MYMIKFSFAYLSIAAYTEGKYSIMGSMLAYMLVHRGPAPKILSRVAYEIIAYGSSKAVSLSLENIDDEGMRTHLQEVVNLYIRMCLLKCSV